MRRVKAHCGKTSLPFSGSASCNFTEPAWDIASWDCSPRNCARHSIMRARGSQKAAPRGMSSRSAINNQQSDAAPRIRLLTTRVSYAPRAASYSAILLLNSISMRIPRTFDNVIKAKYAWVAVLVAFGLAVFSLVQRRRASA
jgi:hypothetical protein